VIAVPAPRSSSPGSLSGTGTFLASFPAPLPAQGDPGRDCQTTATWSPTGLPLVALFGLPSVHLGRVAGVATLSRRDRNAEPSNGLLFLAPPSLLRKLLMFGRLTAFRQPPTFNEEFSQKIRPNISKA